MEQRTGFFNKLKPFIVGISFLISIFWTLIPIETPYALFIYVLILGSATIVYPSIESPETSTPIKIILFLAGVLVLTRGFINMQQNGNEKIMLFFAEIDLPLTFSVAYKMTIVLEGLLLGFFTTFFVFLAGRIIRKITT